MKLLDFFKFFNKDEHQNTRDSIIDGIDSFTPDNSLDGAIDVDRPVWDASAPETAFAQSFYDVPMATNSKQLINQYRALENYHEVDNAIDEIINDCVVYEDDNSAVSLNLDKTSFSESTKKKILEEFENVLRLLDFKNKGHYFFRRWFVDGKIYFHKMINPEKTNEGIHELRLLDARNIEYIRENYVDSKDGADVYKGKREYFVYNASIANDYRYSMFRNGKIKIPRGAIVYAHSGKLATDGRTVIGRLNAVVKPANQLKMLEDAMVIYRITRAPERRIFYIDVDNMPPKKATEYVNNVMQSMKNRVVYDTATGKVKTTSNNLSMTEDYWLQRRNGKAVTDVSTLPGAQSLGELDDLKWFKRSVYEALKLPLSRMPNDNGGVQFGGGSEITRDELQFSKYKRRLRNEFAGVLIDPLRTNCILKKIMNSEEWEKEAQNINLVWNQDSIYEELKDIEILERRLQTLNQLGVQNIVGTYLSHEYIMKTILRLTDEQIKEQSELIANEKSDPRFKPEDLEEF
ncbi:putative portal vertex protein [Vibrio phage vB_VmeM-32]|nr:putative portal vertex protein [Vibrio phage vB_VmeM-32]